MFSARKVTSLPARSCSTMVTPPEVPTPGMAGGGKAKPMASGIFAISLLMWLRMAMYCSSGWVRSDQFFSEMKKKVL